MQKARILPVITIAREEDILPLADALAAGGIRTLEVTLRSQHGLKAIQVLREQRPELCVGAGTVLDRSMFAAVEAAGAQFVVTLVLPRTFSRLAWTVKFRCCRASARRRNHDGLCPGLPPVQVVPGGNQRRRSSDQGLWWPVRRYSFLSYRWCKPGQRAQLHGTAKRDVRGGTWMLDSSWIKNGDWARIEACSAEAMALLDAN